MAFREAMYEKVHRMRVALSGTNPTPLERLLVERIVTCWLRLYESEIRTVQARDLSIRQAEWCEKKIDHANRRYLTAIRMLATVRKLALPVLVAQINVAKNQTNIN